MFHSILLPFVASMSTIIFAATLGMDITFANVLIIGGLGGVGAWMDGQVAAGEKEEEEDDA